MFLRFFIFFYLVSGCFLASHATSFDLGNDNNPIQISKGLQHSWANSPLKKRPKKRKYDFRYIEIGAGPAIWQTSHEPLMENERNAIHFFVEYGDMLKPLSYVAGINFNPAFIQEGYLLEPNYYFFNLKYSPSRKWYNWPIWMNVYGLLGASYWQASLTNTNFGNAGSVELVTETDSGFGFMTGAGVSFEFFNFSLITQFTYELGVGQYEAGAFLPQDVHTGSAQINIMLSYRFFLSGLQWKCPTYK